MFDAYGNSQQIKSILYWFIVAVLIGQVVGIVAVAAVGDFTGAGLILFSFLPIVIVFLLFRYSYYESGVTILAFSLLTLITIMATRGLGIHHISNLGYSVILIIASMVINTRRMLILTSYAIVCIAWLVFGELLGLYQPTVLVRSVPTDFLSTSTIVLITAFLARTMTNALQRSTSQLKIELEERKKAEEEVRRLNAELDQRVIDRTAQLEAANRELETFSYSVSHDLRAPLRSISSFSNILLEDFKSQLDPVAVNYLERINQNSIHMSQLINDLLDLSRLNLQELRKETVDLGAVAKVVIEALRLEYSERNVKFSTAELPSCLADPMLIRQVLTNLLSNALKYTRPRANAIIEIGAQENPGETIYFVRDNGVGFDMIYSEKLFGVFQRLHPATEFEGTGLGLATVQRIIRRHGGRVWAEGQVNHGAIFYFTLPNEKTRPRYS